MVTITWTASAPVTPADPLPFPGQTLIKKFGRVFGSILRSMASSDSDYLGLSMTGHPMWIKR